MKASDTSRRYTGIHGLPTIIMIAVTAFVVQAQVTTFTWDGGGDGETWSDAENWDVGGGAYPNAADHIAVIDQGAADITAPAGLELGALELGSSYSGTLSLAGNLILSDTAGAAGGLTVNGGILQTGQDGESGISAAGAFFIGADGTVIVRRSSMAGDGEGQLIEAESVTIAAGGLLSADGEGFPKGEGPGNHGHWYNGAAHGGTGGHPPNRNTPRETYGSFIHPLSLGSGGGNSLYGSAGGGAIVVVATTSVTVDGAISVDGADAIETGGQFGGAGAGGSIHVTTPILTGAGTIRARGGNTMTTGRGEGGGGRIAFHGVTEDTFSGQIRADAGAGHADHPGRTGTIYLGAPRRQHLVLGAGGMTNLVLGSDVTNHYSFGTIEIKEDGALEIDAYELRVSEHGRDAIGRTAELHVDHLIVHSNGMLSASGRGFRHFFGPANSGHWYDGGGHGGTGGEDPGYGTHRDTYGSFTNPVALGSGGGDTTRGSAGGGALMITASGTVTNHGTIAADGAPGITGGSGAGGSINITTPVLAGTGTIRARGGDTTDPNYCTGGGGRIAFHGVTDDTFSGSIDVDRGTGLQYRGRAGTIYFSASRREHLVVGEGGITNLVLGSDGTNDYSFGTIEINEDAVLEIDAYVFRHNNRYDAYGYAAILNVGDLIIHPNGVLSAIGRGFPVKDSGSGTQGWGPGAGAHWYDGGAHGGRGGDDRTQVVPRDTYGAIADPVTLGSASGRNSWGGGSIVIVATNSIIVNGVISANGQDDPTADNGAGAGGSINISAPELTGTGTISARGGTSFDRGSGGGGRVAVKLSQGNIPNAITFLTHGGATATRGAAGSLYLSTPSESLGHVIFDNNGESTVTRTFSTFPGDDPLPRASVTVTSPGTKVWLVEDVQSGGLTLHEDVIFDLNGHTLTTWNLMVDETRYSGGSYSADDLGSLVVDSDAQDSGRIEVKARGSLFLFR